MLRVLVLIMGLCAVNAVKLPSNIHKCSKSDPDFSACALKEARNLVPYMVQGNRKLQLPPMDPLLVSEMAVEQSGGIGLNFTLRDIRITGMAGVRFTDDFRWDLDKQTLDYSLFVPRLEINCEYSMKGRILVLPISGQGPSNCTLMGIVMNTSVSYDLVTHSDGLQYFSFHPLKMTFAPSKAYISLGNLFNGDPLLGPQTNLFLNDHWQEIVKEMGPSVGEGLAAAVLQSLQAFADKTPYDEFFLL